MASECWKPIEHFEGCYEVSDHGRVLSLDRIDGQGRDWKGRILKLKGRKNGNGYLHVALCKDGNVLYREVHRLVLETFIGPCPEGMEACHGKQGHRVNQLSNLRWDTYRNNALDMIRDGNCVSMKSIKRGDGQVYASLQDAARAISKDASNISKAALGKIKTAYGFTWEYTG